MQRSLAILALTALSIAGWSALRHQRERQLASSQPLPPPLQTWEGEGGGLPDGGPGPRVALPSGDAAVYADAAQRDASA